MKPARFLYDLSDCPLQSALDVLGEKWTLQILRESFYGVRRFDDFARALSCGRGVLSARLRKLAAEGVMAGRSYAEPGQRARTEYHLTEKGRDLYPVVLALSQWSERWAPPPNGPVALVTERMTGREVKVIMTASTRIRPLVLADIAVAPGPGAKLLRRPGRGAASSRRDTKEPALNRLVQDGLHDARREGR